MTATASTPCLDLGDEEALLMYQGLTSADWAAIERFSSPAVLRRAQRQVLPVDRARIVVAEALRLGLVALEHEEE